MKLFLCVFLSCLLLGFFVSKIQAGSGSGSNESGSGSHENHRRHDHKKHRHDYYHAPDSHSYQHYNQPAYMPQPPPYAGYYGMPPFSYSGYYGPMQPVHQLPFYGMPQMQYPPQAQVLGAAYANSGYYHPSAPQATSAGYPGFAGVQYAGAQYAGQAAQVGPPQYSDSQNVGLPLAPQSQVAQTATEHNLGQAHVEGRQIPGNAAGSVSGGAGTGVSSSSLNHHLKVNQEYGEEGHKHSVNHF